MGEQLDFMRQAFMDDFEAISLTEIKYGIKMADWYDAIREGRISNNDFQVMLVDYVNLCRKFWLVDDYANKDKD